MKILRGSLLVGVVTVIAATSGAVLAKDYAGTQVAQDFAARMAREHGFEVAEVEALLARAERQQGILDAIARPAEKSKPWYEYRRIFLDDKRIRSGVEFWREHDETLRRAEQVFGVPPEVIVAIIGVETRYGKVTGSYRVLDALTTLGFDYPPRSEFFSKELEHFLLLTREQRQDPLTLTGSYAGAMGYGQFMPSSYRAYATDFDGDGRVDIWNNPVDAIGSVANYFKVHGWQSGNGVMLPARVAEHHDTRLLNKIKKPEVTLAQLTTSGYLPVAVLADLTAKAVPLAFETETGDDYWLGLQNFYVITRYNRSPLYARAVWELAQAIREHRQTATADAS